MRTLIKTALATGLLFAGTTAAFAGNSADIQITATVQSVCSLTPHALTHPNLDFTSSTPGAVEIIQKVSTYNASCLSSNARLSLVSSKGAAIKSGDNTKITNLAGYNNYFDYIAVTNYIVASSVVSNSGVILDTSTGATTATSAVFSSATNGFVSVAVQPISNGLLLDGAYSDTVTVTLLPN
jgi:hypothetical protein